MDFSYDNYNNFSAQHASPSGRTPAPINYTHNFYPHKPCSYCSNLYHSSCNCPYWGQGSNFSYEQMNRNFSSSGFDSNSNFCNPDWSDHSDFSWQHQAMGNCAPQPQELHHLEYSQFKNQVLHPSSYDPLPKKLTLEETLQAFIQDSNKMMQELKSVTMSNDQITQELKRCREELKTASLSDNENIQNLAKIEGHINYLAGAFNRMEEEELQSQLMAEGHYMIDEDDASHSCHEHAPDTIILESKEIVDNNGEEEKEEQFEHIEEQEEKEEQIVVDIEEQEEKDEQFEHRDQIEHMEQAEHEEKIEPPTDTSLSNDKEVSTDAHSFIIAPFETHHESKALILQCLKEPSYAKILKDLCRQAHKSRNHRPKKIFTSKQVGYLRWRNILPEFYQILKKKGWKGLVGHPHDRGRYGNSF
jgi:hypothetical protein